MAHEFPSGATFLSSLTNEGAVRQNAWKRMYEGYWDYLIGYARGKGFNTTDAEAILQETMVRLITKLPIVKKDYPTKGTFRSYVFKVCSYVCLEQSRRNRRISSREIPLDKGESDSDSSRGLELIDQIAEVDGRDEVDAASDKALSEIVWKRAIAVVKKKIAEETWQIFYEVAVGEEPAQEVAEKYGKKANAVYQIRNRVGGMIESEAKVILEEWGD